MPEDIPAAKPPVSNPVICRDCGAINQEGDEACYSCESTSFVWECPDCLTQNTLDHLTCISCYCGKP